MRIAACKQLRKVNWWVANGGGMWANTPLLSPHKSYSCHQKHIISVRLSNILTEPRERVCCRGGYSVLQCHRLHLLRHHRRHPPHDQEVPPHLRPGGAGWPQGDQVALSCLLPLPVAPLHRPQYPPVLRIHHQFFLNILPISQKVSIISSATIRLHLLA